MSGCSGKVVLSSEQQAWNAVIICAFNVVENRILFNSCDGDNNLYERMFPNSSVAKHYRQGRGKVNYVIEFKISPYINELVKADLQNQPFTFHFNETTTNQVKKQYDGYCTYWSLKNREISTTYCGSFYVGRCTPDDMIAHFHEL